MYASVQYIENMMSTVVGYAEGHLGVYLLSLALAIEMNDKSWLNDIRPIRL